MNKKIYVEPPWKIPSGYREQLSRPPDGYEFLVSQTFSERTIKTASKLSFSYSALNRLEGMIPIYLIKPYLERFKNIPEGIDLTYSIAI